MAEIPFEIITKNTPEDVPSDMDATRVPEFLAEKKAQAMKESYSERTILAADTIVLLHNEILGKPSDEADAIDMLLKLSGQTHQVITGVCIWSASETHIFSDITEVEFNNLSTAQIEYYVKKYKPFDKAGSYAIQEWIGAIGIKRISGCYYNVMGLPVSKVFEIYNKK